MRCVGMRIGALRHKRTQRIPNRSYALRGNQWNPTLIVNKTRPKDAKFKINNVLFMGTMLYINIFDIFFNFKGQVELITAVRHWDKAKNPFPFTLSHILDKPCLTHYKK